MIRSLCLVFALCFGLTAAVFAQSPLGPVTLYVATNGDDAWSGLQPARTPGTADGPFATLARARDAIRELRRSQGGVLLQPVTVLVRGGTYYQTEPLVLTPEDSGAPGALVTIAAYNGEKPVVSGGRRITGWREVSGRNGVWSASVPDVAAGRWSFRQLWVNGRRGWQARHPNRGYHAVAFVPDATRTTLWNQGQKRFEYYSRDLTPSRTLIGAELVVMNRWVENRVTVTAIDPKKRIVSFGRKTLYQLDDGDPYYLENAPDFLDAGGEMYLDRAEGRVYYIPRSSEDLSEAEVIAPAQVNVLRLEGQPEIGRYIEHLVFRGLAFSHTEWNYPANFQAPWPTPDVAGFYQGAFGVPGAVYGDGVKQCVFSRCAFTHVGTYGLELARGCQYNQIDASEASDLGAGGIKIGETVIRENPAEQSHNNSVTDCEITDGGRIFHSGVGLWVGQSFNNRIAHNEIHNLYYTGVSLGWTWGYAPALTRANVLEQNHIHHIGVRTDDVAILSDLGGVYALGVQPETFIRLNRFHDIAGARFGGWGIYFDEGTTGITAENNLVYRTTDAGFHQHYGQDNVIRNNVFAYGRRAQIQRTKPSHRSFTFERNIVLFRSGKLLEGTWEDGDVQIDHNIYWRPTGKKPFQKWTLEQWHALGRDQNSLIANPLFVNPEKDDFRLRPDSPALGLGLTSPDVSGAGPRGKR